MFQRKSKPSSCQDNGFVSYCKANRMPINSEKIINSSHQIKINYEFGIPYNLMEGKKYNEIEALFPFAKMSQLEKDLDFEILQYLGKEDEQN